MQWIEWKFSIFSIDQIVNYGAELNGWYWEATHLQNLIRNLRDGLQFFLLSVTYEPLRLYSRSTSEQLDIPPPLKSQIT
jgi:hypothetical protein